RCIRTGSETVSQLDTQAMGAVIEPRLVVSRDAIARLIYPALALVYVGVGGIQGPVLIDIPAKTEGVDLAVAHRDTHGAVLVGCRGGIKRKAGPQDERRGKLVGSTNGV